MKTENTQPKKKGKGCLTIFIILLFIGILGSCFGESDDASETTGSTTGSSSQKESTDKTTDKATAEATTESVLEPYSTKLSAGIYTAGIDFPAGTYTITATSGTGNVNSSNMFSGGLNEVMSSEPDEYSVKEFKNAKLEEGTTLNISSTLTIKIETKEADKNSVSARTNTANKSVELTSGNYIAGTDFPAGTYDIETVSGSGNVSSSNLYEGGLNEILGDGNDGFSIKKFKNAQLEEGVELTISGVTIKLTPSK